MISHGHIYKLPSQKRHSSMLHVDFYVEVIGIDILKYKEYRKR